MVLFIFFVGEPPNARGRQRKAPFRPDRGRDSWLHWRKRRKPTGQYL